jgi:hypothetical protein
MACRQCSKACDDPYAVAGTVQFCSKACFEQYMQESKDAGKRPEFSPRLLKVLKK